MGTPKLLATPASTLDHHTARFPRAGDRNFTFSFHRKFWVTIWVMNPSKSLKNYPKVPQGAGVRRGDFLLRDQAVVKSFEEGRSYKIPILSLLRMPISPLRLTKGLGERNTLRMNESTARPRSDFRRRNSRLWCNWVKNWVKIFSLAHLRADGRPRSNCSGPGEHNTFR